MYQYRQVLMRMRQGDSDREIARSRIMGRRKVSAVREVATARSWLSSSTTPLPDDAALAEVFSNQEKLPVICQSTLLPWREQVKEWQAADVQGATIHVALVGNHGHTGSYSSVYRLLCQLRGEGLPEVPMRLDFAPGQAAQVNFGASPVITDVHTGEVFKSWLFVMTLRFSRHQYLEMARDQTVATWLACHRHAFEWFGGVPGRVMIDNPKCAITRACIHEPDLQRAYAEGAEGYGFRIDPCPARDPQKKGLVESGVKYVKRGFLPLRSFRDLSDAKRQMQAWVMAEAGNRIHGATRQPPLARFTTVEKSLLTALPDVPPQLATWAQVKVHRDAHVQYAQCLYSAPFRLAGQSLWLKATMSMVQLYRAHQLVATHVRQTHPGSRSTVDDHLPPEAHAWQLRDTQWCLHEAERIGPACHARVPTLFADRVLVKLRAAQGVLRLAKKHGDARLEAACSRANHFGIPTYRAVKTILQKGLDAQAALPAFDALSPTYTEGGRFLRDTHTLLIH